MPKKKNPKFIFVVGGVMSGVGKGISTASIAQILSHQGYRLSAMKIDPYINVDAGTMSTLEHGEVFVTDDGDQTDQDLGNYERFLNQNIYRENYMTTGRVYQTVINRERNMEYGGKCVQVVPHIPKEVRGRILKAVEKSQAEIMVIEIGGTVGEYENLLFLEAARIMKLKNPEDVLFVMVSYLPMPNKIGELKTKPTQHAVRTLNAAGIQPHFIIARSEKEIDQLRREKIAIHCNVSEDDVIEAPDIDSIYEIPINFEKNNLSQKILKKLNLKSKANPLSRKKAEDWKKMVDNAKKINKELKIAIIGQYGSEEEEVFLKDSHVSLVEAIKHASNFHNTKVNLSWLDVDNFKKEGEKLLRDLDAVIIPQDWGSYGAEDKIRIIKYCREKKLPYLGLGYGMQLAIIEFARNVCGLDDASSEEIDPQSKNKVIYIMSEQIEFIKKRGYGETMRLGAWPCKLKKGSLLSKIYTKHGKGEVVKERHRHYYEFNNKYRQLLEKKGLVVSGTSPDDYIVEAIEIKNHPFFIGVQFHPEYISRPLDPHPIFIEFIKKL